MDKPQNFLKSLENAPVNEKTNVDSGDVEIDRISNMPNDVLCHILSFLPTKYAVATSILSSKWKNLLPEIPNMKLCLEDKLHLQPEPASRFCVVSFRKFVERLFNVNLREVHSIYGLRLECQRFKNGRYIAKWVRAALKRNVKRMDILIQHIYGCSLLLDSLFGCNITSLNLSIRSSDEDFEDRFSLPNLKNLSIAHMEYEEVNAILVGCPLVEQLLIYQCSGYSGQQYRMYIPSLKVLMYSNCVYQIEPEIELDCPNLEILNFSGSMGNHYFAGKLKSLRIAYLDLEVMNPWESDYQASRLIEACSDVEKLFLSEKFIMALHRSSAPLPCFKNLVSLAIKNMDFFVWRLLPSLLKCSPNLQNLIIGRGFNMEYFVNMKASMTESWSFYWSRGMGRCYIMKIKR